MAKIAFATADDVAFSGEVACNDSASATSATPPASDSASSTLSHRGHVVASDTGSSVNSDSSYCGKISQVWAAFDGFVHVPSAPFNYNFRRLAKHQGWGKEERREYRVKLFSAEWEAQFGSDVKNLKVWQNFCFLCHVEPIPATVQECVTV